MIDRAVLEPTAPQVTVDVNALVAQIVDLTSKLEKAQRELRECEEERDRYAHDRWMLHRRIIALQFQGASSRMLNGLWALEILDHAQLAARGMDFASKKNIGRAVMREAAAFLAARGLKFAEEDELRARGWL